jgi:hypothetical protein
MALTLAACNPNPTRLYWSNTFLAVVVNFIEALV